MSPPAFWGLTLPFGRIYVNYFSLLIKKMLTNTGLFLELISISIKLHFLGQGALGYGEGVFGRVPVPASLVMALSLAVQHKFIITQSCILPW